MSEGMKDSGVEWIGEIPKCWDVRPLKHFISFSNAGEVIDKTWWGFGEERLYTCASTPLKSGFLNFPSKKRTAENDLLVARNATPYVFKPYSGSIYTNVVQRIRLNKYGGRDFVAYALSYSADSLVSLGVSIPSFSMEVWSSLILPLPPLPEQKAIADFLDRETSLIDRRIGLIEKKRELLGELRKSVIHRAVTKGLDAGVKMMDSGVEWIGEIPEGWKKVRFKDVFIDVSVKGFPNKPLLAATQHAGVILKSALEWRTVEAKEEGRENFKLVSSDDFVISLRSFEGGIEYSRVEGIISPAYTVLKKKDSFLKNESGFLKWLFKSSGFISGLKKHQKGIREGQAISFATLKSDFIPIPSFAEQKVIAKYLDRETELIDEMGEALLRQIDFLNEQRNTLIHEVVTGKKRIKMEECNGKNSRGAA